MAPRTGRPKSDNPHDKVVPVRFTEEERDQVLAAAEADGKSMSSWVRDKSVTAAKRANRKRSEPIDES